MRRGYSIYQRGGKGVWYVAWTDGVGDRQVRKASTQKAIAHEIGRALAGEADRVRGGVVDVREMRAHNAGREGVDAHVQAWEQQLRDKGNTGGHVKQQAMRVRRLLEDAEVARLADLRPEPIQSALAGLSTPNTGRHYLTALRTFVKWCIRTGRLQVDPIAAVERPRVAGETFQRQPLTDEELANLIDATYTRTARTPFAGTDRAMYYSVLAYSGLRKSEAKSLTPESFELEGDEPVANVRAAYSKRRRHDRQPVPAQLIPKLQTWLKGKPAGKPVFHIPKHHNAHRVFKNDCEAAGIAEREGFVLGLHSLRRWAITWWIRTGGLAVAQELARHSTPALTKKYADLTVRDKRRALEGMPSVTSEEVQRPSARNTSRKGKKTA